MTKKACVFGASGLVGMSLTSQLAESNMYDMVTIYVRSKLKIDHPKVEQKIIDYDTLENIQLNSQHVFCCLGTTIKKAGSKEAFKKVDYDYPVKIAQRAESEGAELFAIVTAMGANKNSSIFYNRVKGMVESELASLNIPSIGIFRPSMLLGDRQEKRLGEQVGKVMMHLFDFITPAKYKAIHVDSVAKSMVQFAYKYSQGISIIENDAMLIT